MSILECRPRIKNPGHTAYQRDYYDSKKAYILKGSTQAKKKNSSNLRHRAACSKLHSISQHEEPVFQQQIQQTNPNHPPHETSPDVSKCSPKTSSTDVTTGDKINEWDTSRT